MDTCVVATGGYFEDIVNFEIRVNCMFYKRLKKFVRLFISKQV